MNYFIKYFAQSKLQDQIGKVMDYNETDTFIMGFTEACARSLKFLKVLVIYQRKCT